MKLIVTAAVLVLATTFSSAWSLPGITRSSRCRERHRSDVHVQRPVSGDGHVQSSSSTRLASNDGGNYRQVLKISGSSTAGNLRSKALAFLDKNSFILLLLTAVTAAAAAPSIGKTGGVLRPEYYVGKWGVGVIFLLTGLGMEFSDLEAAATNTKINTMIQGYNLGVLPFVGWLFSQGLRKLGMKVALTDGVGALMCLPTTVNMCVLLTKAAGGAVPTAAFNAVIGQILGLFISPILIIALGRKGAVPSSFNVPGGGDQLVKSLLQLGSKVGLPMMAGVFLRRIPRIKDFHVKQKKPISKLSEVVLLSIAYNAFCDALAPGSRGSLIDRDTFLLPLALLVLHGICLTGARLLAGIVGTEEKDLPAAVYCASHKTLAFGLPLLATMFAGDPARIAAVSTPLLIYHPLQLLVGSAIAAKYKASKES